MWWRAAVVGMVIILVGGTTPAVHAERVGEDLYDKIKTARKRLEGESVKVLKDVVGTRRVRVSRRKYTEVPIIGVVGREMALAIMDAKGEITVVRGIKRDPGLEVLTPGVILSVRRDNGINSDIAVLSPAGGKVLAVKYPVMNEGGRFGVSGDVIEAVYTPYSAEIKNDYIVKRGLDIQEEFIDEAYDRLKKRGVYSRAFPGRKLVEVIPRDVLTVLLINEHIDPGLFRGPGLAKPLSEQVLTIIATNREKAYAYSVSPAGARGLVQMIPSTYTLMLNNYPSAGLLSSFARGMADPVNAVMAQFLLCDADWAAIRTVRDIPAGSIGPYLAAAYNGGVGRVIDVLRHGETDYMEEPDGNQRPVKTITRQIPVKHRVRKGRKVRVVTRYVTRSYTVPIFRSETSKYVKQYHWISDYLSAREKTVAR